MTPPPASITIRPFDDCTTNEEVAAHYKAEFARLGYGWGTPLEDKLRLGELERQAYERIKNGADAKLAREEDKGAWDLPADTDDQAPAPTRPKGKTIVTAKTGSRFTLAHLIEAGKLTDGERLVWTYHGTTYECWVRDGQLALGDGRFTESPSAACKIMNDGGSFNGWKFWISESGKSLLDLRAEVTG